MSDLSEPHHRTLDVLAAMDAEWVEVTRAELCRVVDGVDYVSQLDSILSDLEEAGELDVDRSANTNRYRIPREGRQEDSLDVVKATFNNTEMRVVADGPESEPHVVLKDVADAIGYRASDLKRSIKDKYCVTQKVHDAAGRPNEMICVTRKGLISLLVSLKPQSTSKVEMVEDFQDWAIDVLDEVIETGSYERDGRNINRDTDGEGMISVDGDEMAGTPAVMAVKARHVRDEYEAKQRQIERHEEKLKEKQRQLEDELREVASARAKLRGEAEADPTPYLHGEKGAALVAAGESSESSLVLTRPLVALDLETTGLDVESDKITQIAMYRLVQRGGDVELDDRLVTYVDPEESIPEEAAKVSGIGDEEVEGAPTFEELMPRIEAMVHDADLCGHNAIEFDVRLLESMFERHGSELPGPPRRVTVDTLKLEQAMRGNSLTEVYRRYKGEELEGAHDADVDIRATLEVLSEQIQRLPLEGEVDAHEVSDCIRGEYLDAAQKFRWDGGHILVCFGKHDGRYLDKVAEIDPGYVDWMLDQDRMQPHIEPHL